ncbi:MAG: J domain-containing protein [Spirochaetales bacterium]|uniref:J domain-containing protein n=1 Tax=Candidatus Thalassospirochaeta sargassi TaxID=3119039 RepID=A0AAJ1MIE3_9SPIO|nr:J domain-containing protein [Spirochaetales bacterium]
MKLPFNPRNHIFKAAGALTGLAAGPFGVLFGFTGGALIDQLTAGIREKRQLIRFFKKPDSQSYSELLQSNRKAFTAAAGVSIAWKTCRKDQARLELAEAAVPLFFPEAPRSCAEALMECEGPDYTAAARFFNENAEAEQREALLKMLLYTGIDPEGHAAPGSSSKTDKEASVGYSENDFTILGLTPGAGAEEIKRQYHILAAAFHPDTAAELSEEQRAITEDAFKRIQAAYERLRRL